VAGEAVRASRTRPGARDPEARATEVKARCLPVVGQAWHVLAVHRIAIWSLLGCAGLVACKGRPPSPAEIADRGWRAHELVVTAGERAATCAEAGVAMRRVFTEHRQDFVNAIAIDRDRQKLGEATDYLEAHQDRYADLETRMTGLSERCAGEPTVAAAFAAMASP
jgi:hypothetical protein